MLDKFEFFRRHVSMLRTNLEVDRLEVAFLFALGRDTSVRGCESLPHLLFLDLVEAVSCGSELRVLGMVLLTSRNFG